MVRNIQKIVQRCFLEQNKDISMHRLSESLFCTENYETTAMY